MDWGVNLRRGTEKRRRRKNGGGGGGAKRCGRGSDRMRNGRTERNRNKGW